MAKQTFTTGQVLTAAQMTSLQQTAMGGGAATAKTASYVLVAADAGTTVAMNAAGATTITVNTGLFAAGDTVFIQNLGAGACTVTAGTATVATAGSLILPQNDAGILYFTSASAAIFYDYIQAGAVSPLTTKGDLYTFSTSDARLGVGANGTTLVADSSQATGLKWATASSGGMTLLQTLTLSGNSVTSSSFATTYKKLAWIFYNVEINALAEMDIRVNGLTTSIYQNNYIEGSSFTYGRTGATTSIVGSNWVGASGINISGYGEINNYGNTGNNFKSGFTYNTADGNRWFNQNTFGISTATAISTLTFLTSDPARTFNGGTIDLYGVN